MASPTDTLKQLRSARDIVLRDHTLYPQVVPGIIPVIGPSVQLEQRRWGADFLAETFASQVVTPEEKQQMAPVVLDTLKGYLSRKEAMGSEEDTSVVKSAVQCAASIYPYIFRYTVNNPSDKDTWAKIAAVKSSILRRTDTTAPGVRICCIKFIACVVQTQTPGLIADPRRPEQNEISLALVSRDHPVIPPANLEAEASGLLDRLLGALQDDLTDPLIVTATLNALATLVQRRPSVSSKILTTVLNYNPLRLAARKMTTKDKIAVKSVTRTTMSFLLNCLKRNPNGTFAGRLQQQMERLKHQLTEVVSESHQLKRPAPDEPVDGLDDAKRQRLDAEAMNGTTPLQQPQPAHAALPPGPVSIAQIWTLTNNPTVANFHVERMPVQIVQQLIPALLQQVPQEKIDAAINVVRSRWLNIGKPGGLTANGNVGATGAEDDEEYDPSMGYGGSTAQALDRLDHMQPDAATNDTVIGPFNLPAPPPLSEQDRDDYSRTALSRVIGTLGELDREAKAKASTEVEHGFNHLATATSGGHDREGWIILVTRLATRAGFDLQDEKGYVKNGNSDRALAKSGQTYDLSNGIREKLLDFIMERFRPRIDVAIMWLNEEWYSDRLLRKRRQVLGAQNDEDDLPNYWPWTLRLLDAMIPYFDVKDGRVLIRLLSEIPAVNKAILNRIKKIAEDPERVQLSVNALLYLVMFRPPVRELAIDCAAEMFRENSDARAATKKILMKCRPAVLEGEVKAET